MTRVSLAELASAGFVLHSAEAAAIVLEVCRQYSSGLVPGIPSAHVIRLTPDGSVVAEGPITTDHPPLAKAAHLLNELLPPFGAPPAYRVPGGLRLVVARALRTLDLPAFESLDDFCSAVKRFATADLTTAAQNLYRAWESARVPKELTISDLRRARRATGLSLEDISGACGVSTSLLRELEWGYLKNWRSDDVGRTWLAAYARASGLDEHLVTSIVVPMLEKADPQHEEVAPLELEEVDPLELEEVDSLELEEEDPLENVDPPEDEDDRAETALVASGPQTLVRCEVVKAARPTRVRIILRALASAAAIALFAYIGTTDRPKAATEARLGSPGEFVPDVVSTDAPFAATAATAATLPVHLIYATHTVADTHTLAATHTRPGAPTHGPKAHAPAKHASTASAAPTATRKPAKQNFFKRVLLRIVVK
jgi:transcriptional regulator with XRE-family HTH domain